MLTKRKIDISVDIEPGIPTEYYSWDVESYSNHCLIFDKLVKLGGLPVNKPPVANAGLCSGYQVSDLYNEYVEWVKKNPNLSILTETDALQQLITFRMPKWMTDLDIAANKLRNEVVVEGVRLRLAGPEKTGMSAGAKVVLGGLGLAAAIWAGSSYL